MSLVTAMKVPTRALASGHHDIHQAGCALPPCQNPAKSNPSAKVLPNEMTNQGMTCTKRMVRNVARLALLEVRPAQSPNQISATRLAPVRNPAEAAATTAVAMRCGGLFMPGNVPAEELTL